MSLYMQTWLLAVAMFSVAYWVGYFMGRRR